MKLGVSLCVIFVTVASSSWTAEQDMPSAKYSLEMAVVGNKVFAAGGIGDGCDFSEGICNAVQVFDPEANVWSSGPPMKVARSGFGLAALDSKLYAVGGATSTSEDWSFEFSSDSVEVLDLAMGSWISAPSMTTGRVNLGVAALEGKLYVSGGNNEDADNNLKTMEIFDPMTETWIAGPAMRVGRASHQLAAFGGKLYAVGGLSDLIDDHYVGMSDMEIFDPATQAWITGPSMSKGRFWFGLVAFGSKLYAVGGGNFPDPAVRQDVEVFDEASAGWMTGPSMLNARNQFGIAVIGNAIHVAGGMDKDLNTVKMVERLDNSTLDMALIV